MSVNNCVVKEADTFSSFACYPDCGKVNMEHWKNTVDEVQIWTFLNNEYYTVMG